MINKKIKEKIIENNDFNKVFAEDIIPADDAFHGSTKHVAAEWWYFEAKLNNGYTVVLTPTTQLKNMVIFPCIELYKDGELKVRLIKRYFFQNFQTLKNFPFVKLFDKKIIEFDYDRYNKKGEWVYNISTKIDNYEINLNFIGNTKGWKMELDKQIWIVALPKAKVTGEIVINGTKMNVNGIGYHDHNCGSDLSKLFNVSGWYWGKIMSETLTLTWANISEKSSKKKLIAVLNQDNQGYFNINPENIYFKPDNFIRNHGRKMPTSYNLKIDDVVNDIPIHVDVNMEVKNIHRRFKKLLIAPYWRYHVEAKGVLSLGSYFENVNKTQIMEFFRVI